MATPPKGDLKSNDQEHQKANEEGDLKDPSTASESELPPSRPDGSSQLSQDPVSQEETVPVVPDAPPQEPVPEGDKVEHAPKSLLQENPRAASSILIQLPLPKKWRRLSSIPALKSVSNHQRQESPAFPQASRAPVDRGRERHFLYHTTRKVRVLVNLWRKSTQITCPRCGRALSSHSGFFTRMRFHLKILVKKLQYFAIQHYVRILNRNIRSHPGICNQRKWRILSGRQAWMKFSPLIKSVEQRISSNRQSPNNSNEGRNRRSSLTLKVNSYGMKGPFHCPCCPETYNKPADFFVHMKIHSNTKVAILTNKPNCFLCPYCGHRFTLEGILGHRCPHQ